MKLENAIHNLSIEKTKTIAFEDDKRSNQKGRIINSVDKSLKVLETVASAGPEITVSQISELLGLNISTCHHLVTTLVQKRFLTHLGRSRGYTLGPRLSELLEISEKEKEPQVFLATFLPSNLKTSLTGNSKSKSFLK